MESEATIKNPHFYMETSPWLYISIKTTNLNQILEGRWLARCILENKKLDQENLNTSQALFTTLWTIWNHKN